MNTTILKKCIDELNAENPRLDYLRGMLDTLMEMSQQTILPPTIPYMPIFSPKNVIKAPEQMDDAAMLDARARQAIETIKLTETVE